jgi:hypothetical protein
MEMSASGTSTVSNTRQILHERIVSLRCISGHFDRDGNGGTLSFGAPACMVISVIETRS